MEAVAYGKQQTRWETHGAGKTLRAVGRADGEDGWALRMDLSGGAPSWSWMGTGRCACAARIMDHPTFLPSGDAALTRRAKRGSGMSAVVVRFSWARRRYERQGSTPKQ